MSRRIGKILAASIAGLAACALDGASADAESAAGTGRRHEPWREVWAGAIAGPQTWSAYSGVTFAPFGSVREDGFRFRSVAGYGQYRYSYLASAKRRAFRGAAAFTDLLAGYQASLGPATIKALAGGSAMGHILTPYDPLNRVQGLDYGLKLGLETWIDLAGKAFLQTDVSWSAAFASADARARLGYRLGKSVSGGLELAGTSNRQLHGEWLSDGPWRGGSVGAFARYEWETGELSLSGGLAGHGAAGAAPIGIEIGAGLGSVAKPTAPYASVNWLTRF